MRLNAFVFAMFMVLNVAPVMTASTTAAGCAGASDEVRREVLREYHAEAQRCEDAITEILRREGSTHEQDAADLDAEQARCNESLARIRDRMENHR